MEGLGLRASGPSCEQKKPAWHGPSITPALSYGGAGVNGVGVWVRGRERGERETRGFAIHNQQRHQGMLGGVIETVLQNDPGGHTIGAWLPVGQ